MDTVMGNAGNSPEKCRQARAFAWVLLLTAALGGAALGQTPAGSPVQPGAMAPPAADPAAQPPAIAPEVYLLQPGDEIQIRAFNLPELEQIVKVRPDGKISLLLLNDVDASGHGAEELSKTLSAAYGQFFRNPKVTTIVRTFTNRNVYVGGEVVQPKMIALTGKLSAAAAIFYAGGFKNTAKSKEIIILHNNHGTANVKKLNVDAVLSKGAADVELEPFDVVFVPKSRIAKMDQFVDQYMKQLMPIATSLGFSYILGGQGFAVSIP
jgi:protein involved in polysaccharide export with SLBB domain